MHIEAEYLVKNLHYTKHNTPSQTVKLAYIYISKHMARRAWIISLHTVGTKKKFWIHSVLWITTVCRLLFHFN